MSVHGGRRFVPWRSLLVVGFAGLLGLVAVALAVGEGL